jgi:5'(3')-deoxyribonucleotidase
MKLFVDMDGVLVDFVGGVTDLVGYHDAWPYGEYDICKVVGVNIWPLLEKAGLQWWVDLHPTDEADELIQLISHYDYYICTSPTLDPMSAAGKMIWLRSHYPQIMKDRRFFITPHKHLLAHDHNILIDDSDEQITRWHACGGVGVTMPRPWNKYHGETDALCTIRKMVEILA